MNKILFVVLFQIAFIQSGIAHEFHKFRATSKILLNKRLEPGDVITATGYYADANVQVHFNLENGKCDLINGVDKECIEYNTRLDFEAGEVLRRIFVNSSLIQTIDKYQPAFMQKRRFKYSIKVKPDHFETSLDDQILPPWNFTQPINTLEIFTTYGSPIIETFKVEYGYSTVF